MDRLNLKELDFLIKNHLNQLNEALVAGENIDSGDFIVKNAEKDKLTGELANDLKYLYKITEFTKSGKALVIKPEQLQKWRNSTNVDRSLMSKEINLNDYDVVNVEDEYLNFPESLLDEGKAKASKTKSGRKVPGKYLTKDKAAMKKEIERVSKLKSDDPAAYSKWEADYKARNTKSGKPHKTKKSAATIAYEKKFGKKNENMEITNELINEDVDKALASKAKASGISKSILRRVYSKGAAAWKSGHRPGVSQQQWAMGRVNSFITGSGGARKADADLWAKAKKSKKRKNENLEEELLRRNIRSIFQELYETEELEELYPMLVGEENVEEGLGKYLAGAALGLGLALGSPGKAMAQDVSKDDVNKPKIEKTIEKKSNFDNTIEPDNNSDLYDYNDFIKLAKKQGWESQVGGMPLKMVLEKFGKDSKFKVLTVLVGNTNASTSVAKAKYGNDFKYTPYQYISKSGNNSYNVHYVYPIK